MIKNTLFLPFFCLLMILASAGAWGQVQWAYKVTEYSSQRSNKKYAAAEALGKPNVLPNNEPNGCAWSPAEGSKTAFITVAFKNPVHAVQLGLGISRYPNTLSGLYLLDSAGIKHEMDRSPLYPMGESGKMLNLTIPPTPYRVFALRMEFNMRNSPENCQVDAVGISATAGEIKAEINLSGAGLSGEPVSLGKAVNSMCDEIFPLISSDGKKMFFSRYNCSSNIEGAKNNSGDIYMSEYVDGAWQKARHLGSPLNNAGNNLAVSIMPDGNTLLLAGIYTAEGGVDKNGLSYTTRTEKGWSTPLPLPIKNFYTRHEGSSYSLAPGGKVLLLAVERDDSYGETDFYVSFKNADNTWSEPKHCGPVINSAGFEFSPFLAADGTTLYFGSYGFAGYGHSDMYISKRLDDSWTNWSEPVNMGPGINSSNFDGYYRLNADGSKAYFVSSKNSLGYGDIFEITLNESLRPDPVALISGTVFNAQTGAPIEAGIKYTNLTTGKEEGEAHSAPVDGKYAVALPYGANYSYTAKAKGYIAIEKTLNLSNLSTYKEITENLYLLALEKGTTVPLKNIFFAPASAKLLPESFPELIKVTELLKENPELKIELGGHTDNIDKPELMMELSAQRAKAVMEFLTENGIAKSRLTYKGYGGTRPLSFDNPEMNRRVEFIVTGN